ncbi:heterokaryon incompatibility protein domain-containing protein [Trichoderma chlorosporum]
MASRCKFCTSLSVNILTSCDYEHHETLFCLKSCAELNRCDLCVLFWTCIKESCDNNDIEKNLKARPSSSTYSENNRVFLRGYISSRLTGREIPPSASGSSILVSVGSLEQSRVFGHVGIFAKPNEATSRLLAERNLSYSEDPKLHLSVTRQWLSNCQEFHPHCGGRTAMQMPTRVIKVGKLHGKESPRLFITADEKCRKGRYVALSYCWGDNVRHKVTLKNGTLECYSKSIPRDDMTLAHQEALQIAEELGYQYIWIDALCIIQDDKADWARESSKIADVYSNAELTIVAGRCENSLKGFLGQTIRPRLPPSRLAYNAFNTTTADGLGCYVSLQRSHRIGPVDRRAWCFQESVLSRRMIVYGEEQLSFKCRTRLDYEDGGYTVYQLSQERRFDPSADLTANQHLSQREILEQWYGLTILYSIRNLWDPTDIFATLCGVALRFQRALGTRYLAGLWENDMIRGLLWKSRRVVGGGYNNRAMTKPLSAPRKGTTHRSEIVRAPSWSWTALEGCIWPARGRQYDKRLKDALNFRCRPANQDGITWSPDAWNPTMVTNLPLPCRLEVIGNPKQIRCLTTPTSHFLPKCKWPYSIAKLKKHMIPLVPAETDGSDDLDVEDSVVAYGLSDLEDIGCTVFWAMCLLSDEGLMLKENPDGSFYRLGVFIVKDEDWWNQGIQRCVTII